ncbi:MAG: hypothetical protein IPK85_09655 [Gemmatimonadetes bacterium]|nr:hypothetical protein [Gemmatimonadota bacterium]
MRHLRTLAHAAVLAAVACGAPSDEELLPPAAVQSGPSPAFMPSGALTGADSLRVAWFGNALAAMGEPRLPDHQGEVLRFLWMRTFHRPMAVRLEWRRDGCLVVLSMLEGRAGEALGAVRKRDSTVTAVDRCDAVRASVHAAGFARTSLPPNVRKRDGSEWVFERQGRDGYHVVVRWSPELSDASRPFAAAGRAFLDLAAWDQAPDDPIY